MRAYLPLSWEQLALLADQRALPGPLRACSVDPGWRSGAPDVAEEEWEYEAAALAAQALGPSGGVVLALDADPSPTDDGWSTMDGVELRAAAAVLTADLAWYGVQEVPDLIAAHRGR